MYIVECLIVCMSVYNKVNDCVYAFMNGFVYDCVKKCLNMYVYDSSSNCMNDLFNDCVNECVNDYNLCVCFVMFVNAYMNDIVSYTAAQLAN